MGFVAVFVFFFCVLRVFQALLVIFLHLFAMFSRCPKLFFFFKVFLVFFVSVTQVRPASRVKRSKRWLWFCAAGALFAFCCIQKEHNIKYYNSLYMI